MSMRGAAVLTVITVLMIWSLREVRETQEGWGGGSVFRYPPNL